MAEQFSDQTIFAPFDIYGFILRRENGHTYTNVPHIVTHHSPTGFEWGYGGSGPADLALNICQVVLNHLGYQGSSFECHEGECWELAWTLHQDFKRDWIAGASDETTLPYPAVEAWIKERMAKHER